jgi:diguanylate cyclase
MNEHLESLEQLFFKKKSNLSEKDIYSLFDAAGIPKETGWRSIYRMIFDIKINLNPKLDQKISRSLLEPVMLKALENIKNKDFSEATFLNLLKDYNSVSFSICQNQIKEVLDELYDLTNEFKSMTEEKQDKVKNLESETVMTIVSDLPVEDKIKLIKSKFKETMILFKTDLVRLDQMSNTDHLTGLYNRRFFDEQICIEADQSLKEKIWLNLLMIDIDDFKKFNDKYGHTIGDQALKIVAKNLQIVCHDESNQNGIKFSPIRYGGEEFTVLLPAVDINTAFNIAEKIRKKINNYSFVIRNKKGQIQHDNLNLTVSIGLSLLNHRCTITNGIKNLIENADAAMYDAKKAGKNCIKIRVE